MPLLLLALAALLAAPAARAQVLPAPVRAAADRITADGLMRDVEYLASDALLGRNTPSPGLDSAAVYIARRLERAGLTPLGDNGTFFQHYTLRDETLDTAAAHLEIDGRRFRFGDDFVMRAFAGALAGTIPVVHVGHGWVVPGLGVDPYAGIDVRGRLLLVTGGEAPPEGSGVRRIGRVTVGGSPPLVEAERRGAAGVLFVATEREPAAWARSRRTGVTRLELEPNVPSAYASPAVTALWIRPHVADALLDGDGSADPTAGTPPGGTLHARAVELRRTATVALPLASAAVHRPYNVVALLEGADPVLRDEVITVAAHLDGAVGSAVIDGDSIYNAADDNATGSAGILAIAEQMMTAPRPKRSIIFLWDTGEERGLWGTRRFVYAPPVPLERIVAHFNIDMIGGTRAPGTPDSAAHELTGPDEVYLIGPGVLSPTADSLLERVNRQHVGMRYSRAHDRADSEFFYPRTDAGPFLERGILTIGFFTGLHARYHLPGDEARFIDPAKLLAVTRAAFSGIWMLADASARPRIERPIPESVPQYPQAAVLGTVERFLAALRTRDIATLEAVLAPQAKTYTVVVAADGTGGAPIVRTNADHIADLATGTERFDERIRDPTVLVHGPLALVWTPYDFRVDGEFSHCGIDSFELMRIDGAWRMTNLAWTVEREGCDPGPPARDATADADRRAVLDVVQRMFDAMTARDTLAYAATLLRDATYFVHGVAPDGREIVRVTTGADDIAGLAAADATWVERIRDPVVLLHRPLAVLWAPYVFHVDGAFSHCGVNLFQLLRLDGEWKLTTASWTVETEGCPPAAPG